MTSIGLQSENFRFLKIRNYSKKFWKGMNNIRKSLLTFGRLWDVRMAIGKTLEVFEKSSDLFRYILEIFGNDQKF